MADPICDMEEMKSEGGRKLPGQAHVHVQRPGSIGDKSMVS